MREGTKSGRGGFTLIEVLIAASILLIVVSASASLFKLSFKSQSKVFQVSSGTFIVESKMEEIRGLNFSDLASIGETSFAGGQGRIKVSPLTGDVALIEVSFRSGQKDPALIVETLRSRY